MDPWIPAAAASLGAALAFFVAGILVRPRARAKEVRVPAGYDVSALLALLVRTTRSEAAAVLDRDGLLVDGVGVTSDHAQAIAGNLASALLDARRHDLGGLPAVFEVTDGDGGRQRFRCVAVADGVYIVATLGMEGRPAPEIEREIVTAIPRLRSAA